MIWRSKTLLKIAFLKILMVKNPIFFACGGPSYYFIGVLTARAAAESCFGVLSMVDAPYAIRKMNLSCKSRRRIVFLEFCQW